MSFDFSRVWPLALLALAGNVQGKTVIAAVGDSVTAGDHGLPPFAADDEGNYPFFLHYRNRPTRHRWRTRSYR